MTGITGVSAHLKPLEIRTKVMDTLLPKLMNAYPGFPFDEVRLKVRDMVKWADMQEEPQDKPYLYVTYCMTTSRNGKAKGSATATTTFKKPPKPIHMALVIDEKQYDDCLNFVVKQEVRILVDSCYNIL